MAALPEFQNFLQEKKYEWLEKKHANKQNAWISRKQKWYLPKNSVSVVLVKVRKGVKSEEEVIFETFINLEEKGVYFFNTLTTLKKWTCMVCAINLGREAVYYLQDFQ